MKKFIEKLKRRNVIKATIAYLVFAWLILQVFSILLPILNAPEWVLQALTMILAIGLPIWVIISWFYQITPEGIEKTTDDSGSELVGQATNKRLNAFIIAGLSLAVLILSFNLFSTSATPNKELSLAVIPFDNIRVDENYEWVSSNFTENIHSYLAKISKLAVIDSYSSRQYKDTQKSNAEIGKELNVTYLVRAAITQLKGRLTIKMELIDVHSNKVDWSDTFHVILEGDLLKLHQQTAQKIVNQLKVELTNTDNEVLKSLPTKSLEANLYFNDGVRTADLRGPHNEDSILPLSVKLFQKAIDIDPDYADAYAEMAFVMRLITEDHEVFKNSNKFEKIDSLNNKSLELNPNTVRAYTNLGKLQDDRFGDFKKTKSFYDKALSIKSYDATTHHYLYLYYTFKPEPDQNKALEHIRIAHRLNPFSWPISASLAICLGETGQWEEAKAFFESSVLYSGFNYEDFSAERKLMWEMEQKQDWLEYIDYLHAEIKKDSINSSLYRKLGVAYKEILNDSESYLVYAKKAYQLKQLYSKDDDSDWESADAYYFALLENGRFEEAKQLLADENFNKIYFSQYFKYLEFYLHYYEGKYSTVEEILGEIIYEKNYELLITYAQQRKMNKIDSIFKVIGPDAKLKATTYAILEERDSMYYYLNNHNLDFRTINGFHAFDPYRKEARFKAMLKKNYLPLTHWNE